MTATSARTNVPAWWWIHDVVVGLLAGFGVGAIAGLFANRLVENNVVVLISAILGAVAGIYLLVQNHQRTRQFITGVVVVTWVLLIGSALFLTAMVVAILNFE